MDIVIAKQEWIIMNFSARQKQEDPEVNLVPLIDLLLVILIFLVVTTTYSKIAPLRVDLPQSTAEQVAPLPNEIRIRLLHDDKFILDSDQTAIVHLKNLEEALLARRATLNNPVLVIEADAQAKHQSVVTALDIARRAGISSATFATQSNTSPNLSP